MNTARLINQLRAVERAPEFDEALRTEHELFEDIKDLEALVDMLGNPNPNPKIVEALKKKLKPRYAESEFREALKSLKAKRKAKLNQQYAKYPLAVGLANLRQVDSQKGVYPTVVTSFLDGMILAFAGLIRVGERLTAKGEPDLETFLRSLRVTDFRRDLPDLALVTLDHLLPWKRSYPTFLMGLRLFLFCRRNAEGDRSPGWVAWYDGIFALVAWVMMRATGQKLPKFQKK